MENRQYGNPAPRGKRGRGYRGRNATFDRRNNPGGSRWVQPYARPVEFDSSGNRKNYNQNRGRSKKPKFINFQSRNMELKTETNIVESSKEPKTFTEKVDHFLNYVMKENGDKYKYIFHDNDPPNPSQTMVRSTVSTYSDLLGMDYGPEVQTLKINHEIRAQGNYSKLLNKKQVRELLCDKVMEDMREHCFFIIKNKDGELITLESLENPVEAPPTESTPKLNLDGSKAHQMMLKMGWKGEGLGVNEQGAQETVASKIKMQNREGFGAEQDKKELFNKVGKLFKKLSQDDSLNALVFDPSFSKEERMTFHQMATQYGLRTKSVGSDDNRQFRVTKKYKPLELVRLLLLRNCESISYKLVIPPKYKDKWEEICKSKIAPSVEEPGTSGTVPSTGE